MEKRPARRPVGESGCDLLNGRFVAVRILNARAFAGHQQRAHAPQAGLPVAGRMLRAGDDTGLFARHAVGIKVRCVLRIAGMHHEPEQRLRAGHKVAHAVHGQRGDLIEQRGKDLAVGLRAVDADAICALKLE